MRSPQDFFNAAGQIGYTFNWFYIDDRHIAYFNSGHNPVRAPGTNPLFPTWSTFPWKGYDPTTLTEAQAPESAHPQAIDQAYLTSWNNKQAQGYNNAATSQQFSSVYRSQLLDREINGYLDGAKGKMTLVDLINAMGDAGTQDLRGVTVLPYALEIVGHPADTTRTSIRLKPSSLRAVMRFTCRMLWLMTGGPSAVCRSGTSDSPPSGDARGRYGGAGDQIPHLP